MVELKDAIAIVTGATRGAGRGIARALGERGATVYVTGRSTRAKPSALGYPGTVEDTADEVTKAGGRGIAVACDHADDRDVDRLFARVASEHDRLDVLVNNAYGGSDLDLSTAPFWELGLEHWDAAMTRGVRASLVASRSAAPLMIKRKCGLIVNTSYYKRGLYTFNTVYDLAMNAQNRLAFAIGHELQKHGVAAVALSPGFMRTEHVLAYFKATESTWKTVDALKGTESVTYIGRAVAALAADPKIMEKRGRTLMVADLAREYGFTDADGTQPEQYEATISDLE